MKTECLLTKKYEGALGMEKEIRPLKLQQVKVTDPLFGHYINKVSEVMLVHQWKALNDELEGTDPSGCIKNFRIAAGLQEGERQGVVFLDTDLYKWIESAAYCIAIGRGIQFEGKIDQVIDILEKAQEKDGYLNTYFQITAPEKKWTNLVEGHELYTSGHMIEAAVAYALATGKEKFLRIAIRNADLICRVFGTKKGQIPGVPGHEEIELALIKLYRWTRNDKYLKQADYFVRQRGTAPNYLQNEIDGRKGPEFFPEFRNYSMKYAQAEKPPVEQTEAEGHAVRAMYLYSAMADLAKWQQDKEMEKACDRLWDNMVGKRMYITGGIGSSGFLECFTTDYDLPNSTNYCETCASVGMMMFGQRMAALKKNASYYDTVERVLYNTILAAMNLEGDRYFYVNPLEMIPQFCTENTYMDHVKPVRQKWFSVACCPPNLARTLASLSQYLYACDEKGIYINQFISSTLSVDNSGQEIFVELKSALLTDGTVDIRISTLQATDIRIRVPAYAKDMEIALDGEKLSYKAENSYAVIALKGGDHRIKLNMGVHPRFVAADHNVRADAGKVAVMQGPMVYCLEEADNGQNLSDIYVDTDANLLKGKAYEEFPGEVPAIEYEGYRVMSVGIEDGSLYGEARFTKKPVKIRAVPYAFWNNRGIGEMEVWQNISI